MNKFDEHLWTREQCALDLNVLNEFSALEASFATAEAAGVPQDAWAKQNKAAIKAAVDAVDGIEHAGRHEHWRAEFARLGVKIAARVEKAELPEEPKKEEAKADGA